MAAISQPKEHQGEVPPTDSGLNEASVRAGVGRSACGKVSEGHRTDEILELLAPVVCAVATLSKGRGGGSSGVPAV